MRPRFLEGIRFVDFGWAGASPFSTKVFSDFGAEVINVENICRADPVRLGAPFKDGAAGINHSDYFASQNTGKKSLGLNLKSDKARAIVHDLILHADIASSNFGPAETERLGLSYEEVSAIKADIVYLAMPIYGERGPLSGMLGTGMTISAVTGLMSLTGYRGGSPVGPGTHYPDHTASPYHAAFAVLAALRLRRRTGRGMKINLSQVESTLNVMAVPLAEHAVNGQEPERIGNSSLDHSPHNIFRCKDEDSWCAIAALNDAQWRALVEVMERNDLIRDPGLQNESERRKRNDEVEAAVSAWTGKFSAEEVMQRLQAAGVPAGVTSDSRRLIEDDPQLRYRKYWQSIEHPELGNSIYNSPPYVLDGERVELSRPPLIGEHTDELLSGMLGYSAERIEELRQSGVIEQ